MLKKEDGKREFLNDYDSKGLMERLNRFFESNIEIPRIRDKRDKPLRR
jgi:hypothetical protein